MKERLEEYKKVMEKKGFSKNSIHKHKVIIETYFYIYGETLTDANIDELDYTYSGGSAIKAGTVIRRFKRWVETGEEPEKIEKNERRKRTELSKLFEKKELEIEKHQRKRTGYDDIYNKDASYKDSHSAMWI